MPRRRRPLVLALLVAFVVVPLVEIFALIQVGQVIGAWWTVALLVLDSVIGAWLVKREGGRAWRELREALHLGRMPSRELADGALILVGGALLLTPGFVTDAFGLLLVLPLTRPVFRPVLTGFVASRLTRMGPMPSGDGHHPRPNRGASAPRGGSPGPVVQGDVVDD